MADNMFQSQLDESFVAHQYVIAAQAAWSVDLPFGYWGCEDHGAAQVQTINSDRSYGGYQPACFDYKTLGDELDKAKLTWRFYASQYGSASSGTGGTWSSYQAIRHIYYGPDWKKDVISPNWKFITDVRKGKLANFTWITPVCDDSDHINCPDDYGPSWVSALVNTVGKSKFWNSTVIFIQWDDWGGLYDHVPPPYKDRDSLGFRVPLIMLSPYARRDHISKVQYETASVLRFAEDLFGLDQMAAADRRANVAGGRLLRFFTKTASVREDQRAVASEILHAPVPRRLFCARLRVRGEPNESSFDRLRMTRDELLVEHTLPPDRYAPGRPRNGLIRRVCVWGRQLRTFEELLSAVVVKPIFAGLEA